MTDSTDRARGDAEGLSRKTADVTRRLLESALDEFAQSGYQATTVARIARKCGLTTGAIYARWPTKREMFEAVVEHISEQRLEMLATAAGKGNGRAGRYAGLGAGAQQLASDPARNLWIEACISAARDREMRDTVCELLEGESEALAEVTAQAKTAGSVDPSLDTDAVVLLCQAVELGFSLLTRVQPEQRALPTAKQMNAVMSRLNTALAPPPPNGG